MAQRRVVQRADDSGGRTSRSWIAGGLTMALVAMAWLLIATGAAAATFDVNSMADLVDDVPGDGACDTGDGSCTLRAAVQESNAIAGADTVNLPAGTYVLSLVGADHPFSNAAIGDLDVLGDVTIRGAGPDDTIVDASAVERAFDCKGTSTPHSKSLSKTWK